MGSGGGDPGDSQETIKWTGLPWMLTCHVVVSLAALIMYSICHQPSSPVMSPGGLRPVRSIALAEVDADAVTRWLLNYAWPPIEVCSEVTPVPDRPSSETQSKVA